MIGIIAGTGMKDLGSYIAHKEHTVSNQYGDAVVYELNILGNSLLFLPRHGLNHTISPHLINHRANITALKDMGVTNIISTCSVGSLRSDLLPGTLVLLNDFINAAGGRIDSLYADPGSPVVHTDFSKPYCDQQNKIIYDACNELGIEIVPNGVYVQVTGPRYETPAEVRMFGLWGGDVVGMTGVMECIIAHEAGICYSCIAIVTNLGTGLKGSELQHEEVAKTASAKLPVVATILQHSFPALSAVDSCNCNGK